jgi:hypothetical protein
LLGPIISRLFTCSNAEKKLKKQRVLALVLSLCPEPIEGSTDNHLQRIL